MSSAVVSTSAALGRPFVFDGEPAPEVCPDLLSAGRPPQPIRLRETGTLASADPRLSSITPASCLNVRPAPEMAPSGIAAIDALTGGLPRGCLTEICGPASSGRTTLLLAALAAATARGEFCAVVDASDALDPLSVAAAGVDLDRLLWVRCGENSPQKSRAKQNGYPISRASLAQKACPEPVEWAWTSSQAVFKFDQSGLRQSEHRLEQLLRATDLLLESGGFGLIALDICDVTPQAARRIPLTTWFRFRRAVEHKPTILLAFEQQPIAGSCSSLLLKLGHSNNQTLIAPDESAAEQRKNAAHGASRGMVDEYEKAPKGRKKICATVQTTIDLKNSTHAQLLTKLEITARLERSRLERKPARSVSIAFASKTAWAG
jgi:recA bacterial DNA recombination protein